MVIFMTALMDVLGHIGVYWEILEQTDYNVKKSDSRYSDRRFNHQLYRYVVSTSKIFYSHSAQCF